ncbi:hypothetical protein FUAX_11650 [Fulvitalea axinellae]|uniref:Uncharacterized protein n=1 Tax=Fulvitalea axinellae TaxID=1182444 RepID=A0AAU9CL21_9BACT|nr:hypothetical protein FUAX_11650 [Fulvitalea axinellae]
MVVSSYFLRRFMNRPCKTNKNGKIRKEILVRRKRHKKLSFRPDGLESMNNFRTDIIRQRGSLDGLPAWFVQCEGCVIDG